MRAQQDPRPTPSVDSELFSIPLAGDSYLVYAPLRQAAFVANAATVNAIADLRAGIIDDTSAPLVEFLRMLEIVDGGPDPLPITTFAGDPEPISLTLFLTTACNLRCTYCYASAGDTPTRFMPLSVATRGIDFVAGNARKRGARAFSIAYHGGGEPTVNWEIMRDSLDYARRKGAELGLDVRASTATNGVLSDQQIDWIVGNLAGASVSFDGLPEVHDTHRPTAGGKPSSGHVMHTLRRFDEAGFPYGLRLTVTKDQIPRLPDSVEFVCRSFRCRRIQVEPAYQLGRWQGAPSAETAEFIEAFRAAQERAMHLDCEIHFSAARVGTLTNHFCGVTQDTFALSPDGNVSACYEVFSEGAAWAKTFFYGTPNDADGGYRFDLPALDHLRRQTVQHRDYCRGCFAKWSCAGDCYHKSLTVNGEREFAGTDRCHITRELTKDQLLAKIARSGGLFWHEPPHDETVPSAAGKEELLS